MISLKIAQIRNPKFTEAFQMLGGDRTLPLAVKSSIGRIAKAIDTARSESEDTFKEMIKTYAVISKNENGSEQWSIPEDKMKEWEKEVKVFGESVITLPFPKINFEHFQNTQLSGFELVMLEDLLHGLDGDAPQPTLKIVDQSPEATH
jgi:hypothetical protein